MFAVFGAILLAAATSSAAPRYRIIDLKVAQLPAAVLNDRGGLAGVDDDGGENDGHLLIWDGTQVHDRGPGNGVWVGPRAMNNRFEVCGTFGPGFETDAMFYDGTAFHNLGVQGDYSLSQARALNDRGWVAGFGTRLFARYAFVYVNGTVNDLGSLGATPDSEAWGINESGQVCGQSYNDAGWGHAVLWTAGQTVDLGTLGGDISFASAINDAGMVVGWATSGDTSSPRRAYIFSAGRMVPIPNLVPGFEDGGFFDGRAINDWGVAVGRSPVPFLAAGGKTFDLETLVDLLSTPLVSIGNPQHINNAGQILATAFHPTEGVRPVLLTPLPSTGEPTRLANMSVRSATREGDQVAIAGFVLGGGSTPGTVLARAVGPGLIEHDVAGAAIDPRLDVFQDGVSGSISGNDNWGDVADPTVVAAAAQRVGAFVLADDSADAALLADLPAGLYTAHATAVTPQAGGVVLCELYDAATDPGAAHLVNASMRAWVGTGEEIAIAGFVLVGDNPQKVLIRAVGPGLVAHGVDGVLEDPLLWLYREGQPVFGNNDWGTADGFPLLAQVTTAVGAFTLLDGSKDAVLLAELEPGQHTVHVSGADGGTGVALIEVYLVP